MASVISIKPQNRGKFTARANSKGKSVQAQAASDVKPGSGASEKQRKRAQFAINARKWNKKGKRKGRGSKRKSR
jgi:hypothetical protein